MKRTLPLVIAAGVLFLFFIQAAGTLIASIYILDLMNTSVDAKSLGVLVFFAAIALVPFGRAVPVWLRWVLLVGLVATRSLAPFLSTASRLYASGAALGCSILLLSFLFTARPRGARDATAASANASAVAAGLALAVALSALLRSVGFGIDWSLVPAGGWLGTALGVVLLAAAARLAAGVPSTIGGAGCGVTLPVVGIFAVLALAWFAFSAPSVMARWTGVPYLPVVAAVSALSLVWVALALVRPDVLEVPRGMLATANLLFLVGLTATLLAHRVDFPASPAAGAVVVGPPASARQLPLVLVLLTFPVLFADLRVLVAAVAEASPTPRRLVPGLLAGSLLLVLLVFAAIFTNVWGYAGPVSTPFRNQFWLPFTVAALVAGLAACVQPMPSRERHEAVPRAPAAAVIGALAALLALTIAFAAAADRSAAGSLDGDRRSMRVMTYNIQAGIDEAAERSFERQLALIREVDPDIVALQESDTARVGLNNDDLVRYFAAKLGWHAWYGPATVTGTFGTAVLSRWPLHSQRVAFTYSDRDEIGTTEVEFDVGGRTFTVYNVHPAGSAAAMRAFARTLMERAGGRDGIIVLGDFNVREGDEIWPVLEAAFTEAWAAANPSRVGPDGTDMRKRIDHIMVSPDLGVRDPVYVLPPRSATDHPVHWADITW